MKKKNKKIFSIIAAILIIAMMTIPSFAADGQSYLINIWDENIEMPSNEPIEVNEIEDKRYFLVVYDTTNYRLYMYQADYSDDPWNSEYSLLIYVYQLPKYYNVDITYNRGNYELSWTAGYTGTGNWQVIDTLNTTSTDTTYIDIELVDTLTTQEEWYQEGYNDGYDDGFEIGQDFVVTHPSLFELYTKVQYDSWGIANYQSGLMDGHEQSKTMVGLANVGISGVFATVTQFLNGTSVFGITLMSILISLIVIFVVFLIFKVVRG